MTSVYTPDDASSMKKQGAHMSIMIDATIRSADSGNDNISSDDDKLNAIWNMQERATPILSSPLAKPEMNVSHLASIEKRILAKDDDIKDRIQMFSSIEDD